MNRKTITLLLAICLCLPVANAFGDGHEGGGDHPPMLVIMPPPDTEKPEGVEMTGDPEQDFGIVFDTFFGMMDQDGNGELNMDELRAWVHPGPGPGGPGMGEHHGPGMPGMGEHEGMMGGDMGEKVRMLEEELRRVHEEQRMRHEEEMRRHRERRADTQYLQRDRIVVEQRIEQRLSCFRHQTDSPSSRSRDRYGPKPSGPSQKRSRFVTPRLVIVAPDSPSIA